MSTNLAVQFNMYSFDCSEIRLIFQEFVDHYSYFINYLFVPFSMFFTVLVLFFFLNCKMHTYMCISNTHIYYIYIFYIYPLSAIGNTFSKMSVIF